MHAPQPIPQGPSFFDVAAIVHLQPDAIVVVNLQQKILFTNPAARRLLCRLINNDACLPAVLQVFDTEPARISLKDILGQDLFIHLHAQSLLWQGADAYLLLIQDITAQVKHTRELEQQVYRDDLTGLYNRRGLHRALQLLNTLPEHPRPSLNVIYLAINGLNHVNDTGGHAHGDRILRETASVLRQVFHLTDIKARIGGDEFMVVIRHRPSDSLETRLHHLHSEIQRRNACPGREYQLSLSVGKVQFTVSQPLSLDYILAQTHQRLYVAKNSRKKKFLRFFSDTSPDRPLLVNDASYAAVG
ncbi:MAG: diguanylate cyclase [Gammaproteobacteria bacterium]|nr:diguanylate cyclase [Gammaproteobacteria bacterium]